MLLHSLYIILSYIILYYILYMLYIFLYRMHQNTCTHTTICFSCKETQNLQFYPRMFLAQNTEFRIVPKGPFFLSLQNANFLILFPNGQLLFDNELKSLIFTQIGICFLTTKLEVVLKRSFIYLFIYLFLTKNNKYRIIPFFVVVFLFDNLKKKILAHLSQNVFKKTKNGFISFVLMLVFLS